MIGAVGNEKTGRPNWASVWAGSTSPPGFCLSTTDFTDSMHTPVLTCVCIFTITSISFILDSISPSQPTPGTDGDRTRSVIAAAVASMIICTTFYTLRIVSRIVSRSRILWTDIFLAGGLVACVVISSVDLHGE
jgi:hypothetical protein